MLYYDSNRAVANCKAPRSHKSGKHIERNSHPIREIVHIGGAIALDNNLADPFTKTLLERAFIKN